jgi:signal transduction histidine kinase
MRCDLSKQNIELNFSYGDNLPEFSKGDPIIFQQILLNILNHSIAGTQRGFIHIRATELSLYENNPYITIEIENCKFELNKKDNMRLY